MNTKVKNILRNLGFLLSLPLIIVAFVFAHQQDLNVVCEKISVNIDNPEIQFLRASEIESLIENEGVQVQQTKLKDIDVKSIESSIRRNPWVDKTELFIDANNTITVQLQQKEPVLRVQRADSSHNGYYLDAQARIIPLSNQYFPNLPIITTEKDFASPQTRKDAVALAQYIQKDTFWNASIAQINYDLEGEFELMSVIGDATIRLGSVQDLNDKFQRLFIFYQKGMTRINWDNVKELDLRFKKQVVCKRYHKEEQIESTQTTVMYTERKSTPFVEKPVTPKPTTNNQVVRVEEKKVEDILKSPQVKTEKKVVVNEVSNKSEITDKAIQPKEELKKEVLKEPTKEPKKEAVKTNAKEIIIGTEPLKK